MHNTWTGVSGAETSHKTKSSNPNFNILFPPGIVCAREGTAVTSYRESDLSAINNQWDVTSALQRDAAEACRAAWAPALAAN